MRLLARVFLAATLVISVAACATMFGKQYEYEEQWTLSTDGSAVVVLDASVMALVALRGLALNPSPAARIEAAEVRRVFEAAGCDVQHVSQPWIRHGRRFVQVRLTVPDVRRAGSCRVLAWSSYAFDREGSVLHYHQIVGAPAGGNPGVPKWDGSELVAIKLHVPSRVRYHNVRRIEDGAVGDIERGNILTWESRLSDRLAGIPIDVDVKMDPQSILYQTLWLFGGAFFAAALVMSGLILWTLRRGNRGDATNGGMGKRGSGGMTR